MISYLVQHAGVWAFLGLLFMALSVAVAMATRQRCPNCQKRGTLECHGEWDGIAWHRCQACRHWIEEQY